MSELTGHTESAPRRRLRDVRGNKANRFFEVGLFQADEQLATVGYFSRTWWVAAESVTMSRTSYVLFCDNPAAAFALARLARHPTDEEKNRG